MKGDWSFEDAEVVKTFQDIAAKNIPGYDVVVNFCADYVTQEYPDRNTRIVDVGSALGWTLKHFWAREYKDLTGIDTSRAMIEACRADSTLTTVKFFHSSNFIGGHYDVVLANWTLHFLPWNERCDYMAKVAAHLKPGGVFILTDKCAVGSFATRVYHEWKMRMGLSKEEVARKKEAIEGVLTTRPVGDYLAQLDRLGLDVEIPLVFGPMVTMMCHKR